MFKRQNVCFDRQILFAESLKARDLWHGLVATVDSRTDRVRGVLFTDSNLPTNGTRSSFFFFFPQRSRDV